MDFRLTDDQLALQEAMRGFCASRPAPTDPGAPDAAHAADTWSQLAALDVFRLAAPASRGGLGFGIVDLAVVFEVLGAHLVAGPLVWSALGTCFVPELAAGTAVVGGLDAAACAARPVLVEHADRLDALLLLGTDEVRLVAAADLVGRRAVEPTDPLTPVSLVDALPHGRVVGDATTAAHMHLVGRVLTAALAVGLADRAVRSAVDYAAAREQFGRPIGSFQAIKHLLADAYVRTSLARSSTYAAAAMVDDPGVGDPDRAASAARLLALDAAVRNARAAIQAHGGMGFTWEMVPHLLLKRAWVLEHAFGTPAVLASALADALEREVAR